MNTIKLKIGISLIALAAVFGSVFPLQTTSVRAAESAPCDSVQDDIIYVRSFMRQYEADLYVLASPQNYGLWGYKVDVEGLNRLNNFVSEAQVEFFRGNCARAADLLKTWETEWYKYDAQVEKQIQDIDYSWLVNNLFSKDFPATDKWLKELQDSGYNIDSFISEWIKLKDEAGKIRDNWKKDPNYWHQQLYAWADKYNEWSVRLEAKITAHDRDAYEQWKKALQEWIDYDRTYFDAETADIKAAVKEQLPGAAENLAQLDKYRPMIEQAQDALKNDKPEVSDQLLNKIDAELMQVWSKDAVAFRNLLNQWDKDFGVWLQSIRSRIDALKAKGVDVSELEKSYAETNDALKDAKSAADQYCSTFVECGEGLDEYDGYYANFKYNDIETWKGWWEETLKSYENQEVSYYVNVTVDPVIKTDQGDRVTGPVTIYVDAPGARMADVIVRYSKDGGEFEHPTHIGSVGPENNWSLRWAADEPYDMAEIKATAYGQPDVDSSRTSDPVVVLLPPRVSPPPVTYYVTFGIDPIVSTDQGNRVDGPAVISVDAPEATRAEIFIREAKNSAGVGEYQRLGIVGPSTGWNFKWAADEPYEAVEIMVTAYGQPDVNYSRSSDSMIIYLPSKK